ncbi:TolC family protein [Segnochrobactrum spirostomi]|uniref:TolC family protein n=1 Tax=Segnochrobactrum spirostomi TaxID=2608987 RepID=UPI001AD82028|nr:TolC family protein [Segnochrobactrum spirostomi]
MRSQPWSVVQAGPALLGAVLLLAGCASSDLGGTDPPSLPSAYAEADSGAPVVRRDLTGWWHSFRDPTLDRLVERAAANNLTLAQARARLAAGRAQASAAQSLFLPTVGAGGTAIAATPKTENDDPLRRPLMAGYDMSWDVGLFGLSDNTARAADAGQAMLTADLEAVRVAMTAEVASAYISLRAVQQQQAIVAALIATQRQRMEATRVLVQSGLATPAAEADLTAALAELGGEQAALAARAKGLQQQIATLLGTSTPDAALSRSGAQPQSTQAPRTSRPADLLRARPDVRAAEQKVLQAAAEVGIAQAGLYPRLRLLGSIGVGAPFTSTAFGVAGGRRSKSPCSIMAAGRRP